MNRGLIVISALVFSMAEVPFARAADLPVKALPPQPVCGYDDIVRANNQVSVDFATTNINCRDSKNLG